MRASQLREWCQMMLKKGEKEKATSESMCSSKWPRSPCPLISNSHLF